ncbi:MAG: response regulator transcription factor [Actinobacteria bacterium]|nr:response regulator transcription factor [Actinomycetota bacterium]
MSKIRVLLADDHTILRAGLKALLKAEQDIEVVGEAVDGQETIDKALELHPDIILMDIAMPGVNGLEATRHLKSAGLKSEILILTMYTEEEYLFQAIQAGASGYLLKKAADIDLINAIRTVYKGLAFLYPSATKMLVQDYLERVESGEEKDSYDGLSQREREVLQLIAEGYTSQEAAEKLFLSPKTVETYRSRIADKLGIRQRTELVKYALRKGLLKLE